MARHMSVSCSAVCCARPRKRFQVMTSAVAAEEMNRVGLSRTGVLAACQQMFSYSCAEQPFVGKGDICLTTHTPLSVALICSCSCFS